MSDKAELKIGDLVKFSFIGSREIRIGILIEDLSGDLSGANCFYVYTWVNWKVYEPESKLHFKISTDEIVRKLSK